MDGGGESFIHKVVLLVITAGLTGLVIPIVNTQISEERSRRAELDAALVARKTSIIHSQEEYLHDLEETLFEFNMHAAAVPWYRCAQIDDAKYAEARDAYDKEAWKFWQRMLVLMSKGRRLTSDKAFQAVKAHRTSWEHLDRDLIKMMGTPNVTKDDWCKMLDRVNDQAEASAALIDTLSIDYGLGGDHHARVGDKR